jgi:uncharacterized integral membrane protein
MADREDRHDDNGNRGIWKLVLWGVLLVVLLAFVLDNTRRVKVGFVFGDHETRLIYVLIVTAIIGVLLDRLWLWWRHHRNN